jgi:sarcosine oxidase subunit alpha
MSQPYRLDSGGRIIRGHEIGFRFDGRNYAGYQGDTLASALLANGVHLLGRSFKYHRPRGIMSAGSEEPNALVTVDRGGGRITPNLRATQVELYEGLTASSQNRFPSLGFDLGAAAGFAGPLLSAGFYYKTFLWPASFWKRLYEPAIRAAAGLGRAPTVPDPDRYLHQYTHCDVLVIGAGPAGIAAAMSAASTGARVMLCDEQAELGGSLLSETEAVIEGKPAAHWLTDALGSLEGRVTLLPRTTAFGWYPDNLIGLLERVTDHLATPDPDLPRERLWQVRARDVVIATGAIERPVVFPHNDRPGIMLAGAARAFLLRWAVVAGRNVVVTTRDDSAYGAALALHRAGVKVACILDQRPSPNEELVEETRALGITVRPGTQIAAAMGRRRVHSVKVSDGQTVIPCDTVLMSGGWTPTVHLFSQSRGLLRFGADFGAFLPGISAARERSAGACAGDHGLAACLQAGYAAGGAAVARSFAVSGTRTYALSGLPEAADPHPSAFVDFQNDVTTKDLLIATQEGFRSVEHVKRYTTAGMATDQGKMSNINVLVTMAGMQGRSPPEVGLTTFRPPYTPVTFGAFAGAGRGALFDPVRHAPLHERAVAHTAVFEDAGTWKRARYFPQPGETMHQAVARECLAVRTAAGIFDASTLGKIEVTGPDAAEFLNRIYTNNLTTLAPGRCRYGLLLGEDGFLRDDGVIARLAPDRFHVTTTTGGAASVLHMMEDYLQTEFPQLRAWLTSTTEHWAVIALQGPRARATLSPLVAGIDLPSMPHMSVREGLVAGVPARLFRVSFTGEAGFEINVPAKHAPAVWDALMASGNPTPYGTEAMHVLRAEKGYIVVGQETDGTVIPQDLGLGGLIGRGKHDFVGQRSLMRPDILRDDRRQLVGLLTEDPSIVLEEGAQIVTPAIPGALGHVTSSYWSAALGRSIALSLIAGGPWWVGKALHVPMLGRTIPVTVTTPVFYDPDGVRLDTHESLPQPGQPTEPGLPSHPLQVLAAASHDCPDARLSALASFTRLNVRASTSTATALGLALSVMLGSVPNRAARGRDRAALWLGPDEWLVLAPSGESALMARAMAAVGDRPASIVDVSHRTAGIEISGSRAAWCLNGFCALDLAPHTFPVGMCTRTLFGKAEIVLWRTASTVFHIEVARSYAPYVWQCLEEARREFVPRRDPC